MRVNRILNEKIWDTVCDDPDCEVFSVEIKPDVRKALLKIAYEFIQSLDVKTPIVDIIFTGSMANYNYTGQSDIDLHILYDFDEVNPDQDLVKQFMDAKRRIWNSNHDLKVYGHDVELYPQDSKEPHHSTGIFSVLKNKWVLMPLRSSPLIDEENVSKKTDDLMNRIDSLTSIQNKIAGLKSLKDKIMKMRKAGLEREGEFSEENLVFKNLRNSGYIGKLNDIIKSEYDDSLSLI
tara:strand:- start:289 stop:993 length:705 start_codon:yes stop_codon:yes gene_type:complete